MVLQLDARDKSRLQCSVTGSKDDKTEQAGN